MPETAKTRQPRQRTQPAATSEVPAQAAEDAAAAAEQATDVLADVEAVDDAGQTAADDTAPEADDDLADEVVEPEPVPATAQPVKSAAQPEPAKTPSKRQVERELKAAEKRRIAAEAERRKADFTAARIRQQEADRVQVWAERRQAEADKARAKAEKASAKLVETRKAAGDEPTGLAARRVESAERWEVYTREKLDRTQSDADALRKRARKAGVHSTRAAGKVASPGSRQWVPPTFITVGLVGVAWLVVYYITASTSIYVPGMTDLGGWNVIIGMGLMASAFGIATLWK